MSYPGMNRRRLPWKSKVAEFLLPQAKVCKQICRWIRGPRKTPPFPRGKGIAVADLLGSAAPPGEGLRPVRFGAIPRSAAWPAPGWPRLLPSRIVKAHGKFPWAFCLNGYYHYSPIFSPLPLGEGLGVRALASLPSTENRFNKRIKTISLTPRALSQRERGANAGAGWGTLIGGQDVALSC